jgi:glutamate dehydrogenase
LAKAAIGHLAFGSQRRTAGQPLVRVFNPDLQRDGFESPHTVVLLVTDDAPFLVDSLGIVFRAAEAAVHLIVHPVLDVRRDARGRLTDLGSNGSGMTRAESWQLYEIDRRTEPEQLEKLEREIASTLSDVHVAVSDWSRMRDKVKSIISSLESNPPPLPADDVSEGRRLLEWMEGRHFVFLGFRHYNLERGSSEDRLVPDTRSGLGILRSGNRGTVRSGPVVLRGDVRARARESELLIVTKANSTATVHRGEYLDYIGVKTFAARG